MSRVVGGKRLTKNQADKKDKKKGPLGFLKNVLKIGKKDVVPQHPAGGGGETQATARGKLQSARNVQKENPNAPGSYASVVSKTVKKSQSKASSNRNTSSKNQTKTAKETASDRHKTFKADRKLPLGEKSFNKGRPKSEWVKSAYERRQKDATKRTQAAAAKSHDAFQKKHGRGKYSKRAIAKQKKKDQDEHLKKVSRIGGSGGFAG
jgi:hypothetical protein